MHPKWRYVYRSAITGKFVTRKFADDNPDTTICEGKFLGNT
jgi:hypothetical protein